MSFDVGARALAASASRTANAAANYLANMPKTSSGATLVEAGSRRGTFRSGVVGFVPAAAATDIARMRLNFYRNIAYVERIIISGTATSASILDVLIQRSSDSGGGSSTDQQTARLDQLSPTATAAFGTYAANRPSNGNGISGSRPLVAAGKLFLGSGTTAPVELEFTFEGPNRPTLRGLSDWLVINLNGQTIPAGCSLNITVEWSEEIVPATMFAGDSTTSNATTLWEEMGLSGSVNAVTNFLNAGSNGMRIVDFINNTNGVIYPMTDVINRLGGRPGVLVLCYGINDLRTGEMTRNQLISAIDAIIHFTLNGGTAGQTYTSTVGANTTFTLPANATACPDAQIVLWGPNSFTTDGNGSNFVTLTGRWSGMTVAQAAQAATDDLREAYAAFANDPRVFRVVQKQDIFGTTSTTLANSGVFARDRAWQKVAAPLMTDILHPNARGQVLSARQITPVLADAIAAAQALIV